MRVERNKILSEKDEGNFLFNNVQSLKQNKHFAIRSIGALHLLTGCNRLFSIAESTLQIAPTGQQALVQVSCSTKAYSTPASRQAWATPAQGVSP